MSAMPENPQAPALSDPERGHGTRGVKPQGIVLLAVVLGALALGLAGWQSWTSRGALKQIETALAGRLKEQSDANRESLALAREAQQTVRDLHAKIATLENKLAESQNQQLALEALYQELSSSRDAWLLADIEQALLIASQQLQLAGNVKAALIALEDAELRLARLNKPQFISLRKALVQDIERLKATPRLDTVGVALRLDNLVQGVDRLKPEFEHEPPGAGAPPSAPASEVKSLAGQVWSEIRQLIRIRRLEHPELPLLAPDQIFFLRQNLKLRLLSARLALLARDQVSFEADLRAARDWVSQYFSVADPETKRFLETLASLAAARVNLELPDVSASLEVLRKLRGGE
jgi:uroporphyrin-III C-methyltransferase